MFSTVDLMVNYVQFLGEGDQKQDLRIKQCIFGLKLIALAVKTGQGNRIVKDVSSGM